MRSLSISLALLASTAAAAHDEVNRAFPAERLDYAVDSEGMGNTEWAGIPEHLAWDAGLLFGYENDPLYVYTEQDSGDPLARGGVLIENRLHAEVFGQISVFEWIEIGAALPVLVFQNRDNARAPEEDADDALGFFGVGDLRLQPKVRVLRQKSGAPLDLAVLLPVTLPTGQFADYFGSESFAFTPMIGVSRTFGGFKLAGNLGHRFRPEAQVFDATAGNELVYRAAVGYVFDVIQEQPTEVSLNAAGVASTKGLLSGDRFAASRNPLEVIAEVDHTVWGPIHAFLGGGAGLVSGNGGPDFRLYAGARFAMREDPDFDGDGFVGEKDLCPREAENKNDYQDTDGCPDVGDDDKDGILNDADKCPSVAEDKDGFQDEDGCPDDDHDGDGLKNDVDKCPTEPEDKDGHDDTDGCPDPDDDGDGVLDGDDKCKTEAEDKDNFQDEDGCPDPDNDGDGILDAADACRDEAGSKDNKGCPDKDRDNDTVIDRLDNCPDEPGPPENGGCAKKQLVVLTATKIEIKDKVYFKTGKDVIEAKSFPLLDNIADVLKAHPEIAKIRVEGHTDNVGDAAKNKDLSDRRAKSVVKYLTSKGVDAARLEGVGFGLEKPVADNATEEGRANNRRVEFYIAD